MPLMQPEPTNVPSHQTVRSVVKATQLLLCIAESDGLTAGQAAAALGIPLPTAYHLLNTLLAEGWLNRDAARRYHLGPKIATLSLAYSRRGPSELLLAAVRELVASTGETAYLSDWRDGQVTALATIEGSNAVRVGRIHTELKGCEHARASGKVLLAHLDGGALDTYLATHTLEPRTRRTIISERQLREQLEAVRSAGFALDEGEFTEDVGCVSAPIHDGGRCAGCLSISAPLERFASQRERLTQAVVSAANSISST